MQVANDGGEHRVHEELQLLRCHPLCAWEDDAAAIRKVQPLQMWEQAGTLPQCRRQLAIVSDSGVNGTEILPCKANRHVIRIEFKKQIN